MKTRVRIVEITLALMMCAGCALFKTEKERNEVVAITSQSQGYPNSFGVTCIVSTDNVLKTFDVCTVSSPVMLQAYRIEGCKISNYRWSNYLRKGFSETMEEEHEAFAEKYATMRNTYGQLPNRLGQSDTLPQSLNDGPVVAVTEMNSYSPFSVKGFITWNDWNMWLWTGSPNEVPTAIEAFRKNAAQVVAMPEYAMTHRAYLRAIPLFTEEALAAEHDTPLISIGKTRYHARFALSHPYLLVPVPERKSPFYFKGYSPGDKFKVRQKNNKGEPFYFLIETFKGEKK